MYLQLYILSSIITYAFCRYFLQSWDPPYTEQRTIALRRSMENYLHFTFASLVLSYHGFGMLPTVEIGIWHDLLCLALWAVASELIFSISHYALHNKHLYWIHKQHNENNPTYSTSCLDCHPIEMLLANVIPLFIGMFLMNSHIYTWITWVIFAVLGTQTHHCGYEWPWMVHDHQPSFHDFHHQKFTTNYGNIGLLDKLHGTDVKYMEHLKKSKK